MSGLTNFYYNHIYSVFQKFHYSEAVLQADLEADWEEVETPILSGKHASLELFFIELKANPRADINKTAQDFLSKKVIEELSAPFLDEKLEADLQRVVAHVAGNDKDFISRLQESGHPLIVGNICRVLKEA